MFYEAYELFDKGRYHECLPMFKEISETSNDERFIYWSLILLGRCLNSTGGDPLDHFIKAYNIFPERAEAICDIGNYYFVRGDLTKAEEFLKMTIVCKKQHRCIRYESEKYFEMPHEILIDIFMRQSRFNDSEELLTSLIGHGNRAFYDVAKAEHNHLYSRFFNNAAMEFVKAKTIEKSDTLIIQLPNGYDGLGDNLVFSHIPRIAKEVGGFKQVLVSNQNRYKGPGYAEIAWETNPYVDGFTDLPGTYSSIQVNRVMDKWNNIQPQLNLMDSIMLLHDIDDGKRGHVPECYYKPEIIEELGNSVVIDAGSKTIDLSLIDPKKFMSVLENNEIFPDYIITTSTSSKSIDLPGIKEICPSSIKEWANIMCSAKKYVCFNSGGYWLSSALGVRACHIWIESKNLPAWSYLDHDNIRIPLSTISLEGI
jgi:hypothetical protein